MCISEVFVLVRKAILRTSVIISLFLSSIFPTSVLATPIAIVNPSFEALAPGVSLSVRGWTCDPCFQSGGTATSEPIVGWNILGSGDAGTWYPSAHEYPGGGALTEPATGIPDGINVAYSNGPGISQVLVETLRANHRYTLKVDVGNRSDLRLADFSISLLAGGNLLESVVSSSMLSLPPVGSFSTFTLAYDALGNDMYVDQRLEIRFLNHSGGQTNYDNVSLTATSLKNSVSEPGMIFLMAFGLCFLSRIKIYSARRP